MEINFIKSYFTRSVDQAAIGTVKTVSMALLSKLNSYGYTQVGDIITLKDGTMMRASEIPRLSGEQMDTISAKDNVMDFGSAAYFRYTNSSGKSFPLFSMPGGAIGRLMSEFVHGFEYDEDTQRYISFWNSLGSGHAMMGSRDHNPKTGYYNHEIRAYLDEAGISEGFFL